MESDNTKTVIAFVVLLAIITGGTVMSPMSTSTVMVISVGLLVFGVFTLFLEIKHCKYRANRS